MFITLDLKKLPFELQVFKHKEMFELQVFKHKEMFELQVFKHKEMFQHYRSRQYNTW